MTVALVTDSTAYLPADVVARKRIRVVPLHVRVGGTEFDEGIDITTTALAEALRAFTPVSTSRPSPMAFLDAYRSAAAQGATGVVSVHISSQMSGTAESAALAAVDSPIPVRVVDSRTMGMAMGYAVLSAAAAAGEGVGLDDVAAVALRRAESATVLFYVDTLEYLRRGGRIGAASRLLGSAFAIKPLLSLQDGRIQPVEKVRTAARALSRLEEMAAASAERAEAVDIAVHHLDASGRATELAERLQAKVLNAGEVLLVELGAVVGAHVGPGTIAVAVSPRRGDDGEP